MYSRRITIKDANKDQCFFNTTDAWIRFVLSDSLHYSNSLQIIKIVISCNKAVRLRMLPYVGKRDDNAITSISIDNCKTNVFDWNQLSPATDMLSLNLFNGRYRQNSQCDYKSNYECTFLKSAIEFLYSNKDENSLFFENMLSCEGIYPEMAAVGFDNMSLKDLPDMIMTMFPNLQSLHLPRNKFTSPPNQFPWTNKEKKYPRNLSRSADYSRNNLDIKIPVNVLYRVFNLAYNKIANLTEHNFHGYIHFITLKGNGMFAIGSKIFQNTSGLQRIDLSQNKLIFLPKNIFKELTELRYLNISNNMLTIIQENVFDDLTNLRYLSLANNKLHVLPKGLLINLHKLKALYIQHNFITTLSLEYFMFPICSAFLAYINVQHNPITALPSFIFKMGRLSYADFSNTDITFENFTEFINTIEQDKLENGIQFRSMSQGPLIYNKRKQGVVDLSNSLIKSLFLEEYTAHTITVTRLLFQHFTFNLTNNPLVCDCRIMRLSGLLQGSNYVKQDWICQYPRELEGRPLLSVKLNELYCIIENLPKCPASCICNNRSINGNIIVDCRNRQLTEIHEDLPEGNLELWYNYNNITCVEPRNFLDRVIVLDVSHNHIKEIVSSVFKKTRKLEKLFVQCNLLTYIPKTIEDLDLKTIEMGHNHFHCDCTSLWVKNWIQRNKFIIKEWSTIKCTNQETGKLFIEVKDSDFVCREEFNPVRDVVTPTVSLTVLLFILFFIYAYRFEIKVLMYIYLGIHPFDRDNDDPQEHIDCVIVHIDSTTDWVMETIVTTLEANKYSFVVCDMSRDFIAGFSMQDNLARAIHQSKRIIFCVSVDFNPSQDTFNLAWQCAVNKIKRVKTNYGIVVAIGIDNKEIADTRIPRFINSTRIIDSSKPLFIEKVIYSMPVKKKLRRMSEAHAMAMHHVHPDSSAIPSINMSLIETEDDVGLDDEIQTIVSHANLSSENEIKAYQAFISYPDGEFSYAIHVLRPLLETEGFQLCIPDRDFMPGASIQECIINAVDKSERTILTLGNNHIDGWMLFTFRVAFERTLREKTNHLIVILIDDIDTDTLDEEIRHYLKTYVSISRTDKLFEQKLFNALPLLGHSKHLHTSPLLISCARSDNITPETDI